MALKSLVNLSVSIVGKLRAVLTFAFVAFDIRPVFFFGGLILLGYGLFLYLPWVSFAVCGVILMVVGWLMGDKK
jgi:hypothetical protein